MPTVALLPFEDESSMFSLASEYLEAAEILARAPVIKINVSFITYYLLGHAAELLLKSYLYKNGVSVEDLRTKYGHNLAKLIKQAQKLGLPNAVPLNQIAFLSKIYKPKGFEYRQLQAATFPPQELLFTQVRGLERQVFNHIAHFSSGV